MEQEDGAPEAAVPPPAEFRKPKARGNVRKRPRVDDDDANRAVDAAPQRSAVRSERAGASIPNQNPFIQTTARANKGTLPDVAAQGSDRRITTYDNKIFATNEQETSRDRDAQAIFERAKELEATDDGPEGGKVYRGMNNYRKYTERPANFDAAVLNGHGPQRAPVHYRAVCRFDYQPDICKDYKETGFCGYGDACKFMHDRGDYKSGWQLERDWDAAEKDKQKRLEQAIARGEDPADVDDEGKEGTAADGGLPFACLLCRNQWTASSQPVVTKCGHHFCEACACSHFAKHKRCPVCNELTHGVFNAAKRLREHIKQRLTAKASAQAAGEKGQGSDDEEQLAALRAQVAADRSTGKQRFKPSVSSWAL